MSKINLLLLILVAFSTTTLNGYALTEDNSANGTIVDTAAEPSETITVNENTTVINITENSNETNVVETVINDEQKKSTPGFLFTDTVMSLFISIIVTMSIFYNRKTGKLKK